MTSSATSGGAVKSNSNAPYDKDPASGSSTKPSSSSSATDPTSGSNYEFTIPPYERSTSTRSSSLKDDPTSGLYRRNIILQDILSRSSKQQPSTPSHDSASGSQGAQQNTSSNPTSGSMKTQSVHTSFDEDEILDVKTPSRYATYQPRSPRKAIIRPVNPSISRDPVPSNSIRLKPSDLPQFRGEMGIQFLDWMDLIDSMVILGTVSEEFLLKVLPAIFKDRASKWFSQLHPTTIRKADWDFWKTLMFARFMPETVLTQARNKLSSFRTIRSDELLLKFDEITELFRVIYCRDVLQVQEVVAFFLSVLPYDLRSVVRGELVQLQFVEISLDEIRNIVYDIDAYYQKRPMLVRSFNRFDPTHDARSFQHNDAQQSPPRPPRDDRNRTFNNNRPTQAFIDNKYKANRLDSNQTDSRPRKVYFSESNEAELSEHSFEGTDNDEDLDFTHNAYLVETQSTSANSIIDLFKDADLPKETVMLHEANDPPSAARPALTIAKVSSCFHRACFDTGSAVSIVSLDLVEKANLRADIRPLQFDDPSYLSGIGKCRLLGRIHMEFDVISIDRKIVSLKLWFLVVETPIPLLIGNDNLRLLNFEIDLKAAQCTVGSYRIPLIDVVTLEANYVDPLQGKPKAFAVFVDQTTLPPRTVQICKLRIYDVNSNSLVSISSSLDFNPNIVISPYPFRLTNDVVEVEVLNLSSKDLQFEADHIVSHVAVLDESNEPELVDIPRIISRARFRDCFAQIDIGPISEEQKAFLFEVLYVLRGAFSYKERPLGYARFHPGVRFPLTQDTPPKAGKAYRVPPLHRTAYEKYLTEMRQLGVIEPSHSAYSSGLFMVPKAGKALDEEMRGVHNYVPVNEITIRDSYPLTTMDEMLNSSAGCRYLSVFDHVKSFFQIPIKDPEERKKTAFYTPFGQEQYTVLPMGMTNSPAEQQRHADAMLGDAKWKFSLCYIDDQLVFSRTFDDHMFHISVVLSRIIYHGNTLSIEKAVCAKNEVDFLGHVLGENGLLSREDKCQAVLKWSTLTSRKEIRMFLGFANQFKRYIPNFALMARPFFELLKGSESSIDPQRYTSPEVMQALKQIKDAICSDMVLASPDFKKPFRLYTDGSKAGIGVILTQINDKGEERPIIFNSRTLKGAEKNYGSTELELLAIFYALRKLQHYLHGAQFEIITDHSALCSMLKMKTDNRRILNWIFELEYYRTFITKISHRKGTKHQDVDFLSRKHGDSEEQGQDDDVQAEISNASSNILKLMEKEEVAAYFLYRTIDKEDEGEAKDYYESLEEPKHDEKPLLMEHEKPFAQCYVTYTSQSKTEKDQLFNEQVNDKAFAPIIQALKGEEVAPRYVTLSRYYSLIDGVLYFKHPKPRLCIPQSRREEILKESHDSEYSGHRGRDKLIRHLVERYYWPRITKDIRQYVSTCHQCQAVKFRNHTPFGSILPHDVPLERWETIAMDFAGPFAKDKLGREHIMIVICLLSKRVHLLPVFNTDDAKEIAEVFFNNIFRLHGLPLKIVSDRDPKFRSTFWQYLFKLLNVKLNISTSGHAQTDGASERVIQMITNMLRSVYDKHKNFGNLLSAIEFAYNSSVHSSTGYAPFELDNGRSPLTPLDLKYGFSHEDGDADVKEWVMKLQNIILEVQDNLHAQQMRMICQDNNTPHVFKPGDLVMVSSKLLSIPHFKNWKRKLTPNFIGPFTVRTVHDNACELELPKHLGIHKRINVKYLKRYNERLAPKRPDPMDGEFYEVERIVGITGGSKRPRYIVKWAGYPDIDSVGVPKSFFKDKNGFIALLKEYERKQSDLKT